MKMKAGKALTPPIDMSPPRVQQTQLCLKVFVQRDYSDGTTVKFQSLFPPELEGKLDHQAFENTIGQLNAFFREAEKGSCSTYCEGCVACLTAYLMFICAQTHYEKCLRKIDKFVQEQNERVYKPRGLLLTNPVDRGLRVEMVWKNSFLSRPYGLLEASISGYELKSAELLSSEGHCKYAYHSNWSKVVRISRDKKTFNFGIYWKDKKKCYKYLLQRLVDRAFARNADPDSHTLD